MGFFWGADRDYIANTIKRFLCFVLQPPKTLVHLRLTVVPAIATDRALSMVELSGGIARCSRESRFEWQSFRRTNKTQFRPEIFQILSRNSNVPRIQSLISFPPEFSFFDPRRINAAVADGWCWRTEAKGGVDAGDGRAQHVSSALDPGRGRVEL